MIYASFFEFFNFHFMQFVAIILKVCHHPPNLHKPVFGIWNMKYLCSCEDSGNKRGGDGMLCWEDEGLMGGCCCVGKTRD